MLDGWRKQPLSRIARTCRGPSTSDVTMSAPLQSAPMDKSGRVRLIAGVLSALIGAGFLFVSLPRASGEPFDGSVTVVPGQPGVGASVTVRFDPADRAKPTPGDKGELSVSLTNTRVEDSSQTHWYVFLADDAILDDVRVEASPSSTSTGKPIDGVTFRAWRSGKPEEYQVFDVTGSNQVRLVGTPRRSPIAGNHENATITMPKVLTNHPDVPEGRTGGVLLVEEPAIDLLLANPRLLPTSARGARDKPVERKFLINTGFSQSSQLRVDQVVPDLAADKWGSLIVWESNYPFASSATFSDPGAARTSAMWLAVSFLFFGLALPLMVEGILHRAPSATSRTGSTGSSGVNDVRTGVQEVASRRVPVSQPVLTAPKSRSTHHKKLRGGPKRRR